MRESLMTTETTVNKLARPSARAVLGKSVFENIPLRLVALLLLLLSAPLYESRHLSALLNRDIWWHLRTGLWMLQNHAIPRHGLFSQYPWRPWVASSWDFDVWAATLYKLIGLRAVPAILMGFRLALAAVTFLLAYVPRRNFWFAALLSAAAQYGIVGLQPLPTCFSILFYGIELILLFQSRRTGEVRPLLWLPLLFVSWANLHPQFALGLILLGLFVLAEAAELLHIAGFRSSEPSPPFLKTLAIAAVCCAATLLTPYSFHLFRDIIPTLYSNVQMEFFAEMNSMAFRSPQNFVLLLLVMIGFLVLGRQRSRDLFKLWVMILSLVLGFRFQRDAWCVVLPALAVIADALPQLRHETGSLERSRDWRWGMPLAAALVLAIFAIAIFRMPSNKALEESTTRDFPLKACDYIRANHLPEPIFNSYVWGGFLTFYLPEYPVAIDGRTDLYGDEVNARYFRVAAGITRVDDDPSFANAQTILLERKDGLANALTTLPHWSEQFRQAYQDDTSVVLVRKTQVSKGQRHAMP